MIEKLNAIEKYCKDLLAEHNKLARRVVALEERFCGIAPEITPAKQEPKQRMVACSGRSICKESICPVYHIEEGK